MTDLAAKEHFYMLGEKYLAEEIARTEVFQVMPPLSASDYEALKADIAERGIMVPIEVDETGTVLDGHHRLKISQELDIPCPKFERHGLSEADKRTHARQLNIARRHLNQEQKRELIAGELKDNPERSNRQIGDALGVDHKTTASVRAKLEAGGEIPHHETIVGKDGVRQPAKRPKTVLIDDSDDRIEAEPSFAYSINIPSALAGGDVTVRRRGAGNMLVVEESRPFVANNSGKVEWYTPDFILDAAREVLGGIDFDPASCAIANERVRATKFFTAQDDALSQEWPVGKIWMNPPYARDLVEPFCTRFLSEIERGSVGMVLVNNATETGWFQAMAAVAAAICFPSGRVRFVSPDGEAGAPLQGQAVLYFGDDWKGFKAAFCGIGFVVRP